MAKGFTCECKTYHEYPLYVAAHWREALTHTCQDCGRQHSIFAGKATLIKSEKK